jgi:hypothetical protein
MMALADAAVGLGSMIEHCRIGHLRRRPKGRTAGGGTGGHASDVAIPQVRLPPIVKNSNFRFVTVLVATPGLRRKLLVD